jgi:hypothetical protein
MEGQLNFLPPLVSICIPPHLEEEAKALAAEEPPVHPAWKKARHRGRHFVITTDDLDDITEIADFARTGLEEPVEPLTKIKRQAYQILLDRAYRHAVLEPMGHCHCMAVKWREKPLKMDKNANKALRALRR